MAGPDVGIKLTADTAQFQAAMTRASKSVDATVGKISQSFRSLNSVLGTLGVGLSAGFLVSFAKDAVLATEAIGDLADVTGSSVENLSRIANQAKVAGGSFDEFEGALLKFTAKLGDSENVTKEFAQALKVLGVTSKDPATALQQTIAGFDKFANSATKAAYAKVIFDKAGPRFMATLADMAKLQDVNATLTAKNAEETEKFAQAMRRLSVDIDGLTTSVMGPLITVLNESITRFRLAREAGQGFFASLRQAGREFNLENIVEPLEQARKKLEDVRKAAAAGSRNWARMGLPIGAKDIAEAEAELRALVAIQDDLNIAARGGLQGARKQELPQPPKVGTGTGAERLSDAQRYLDNLKQQLDKTKELSATEQLLSDVQSGRLKLTGAVTLQELTHFTQLIDLTKEADKELEARKKLQEDEAKLRERTSQMTLQTVEGMQRERDAMLEQNQAMREETELIGKDVISIERIIQARIDDTIALKKQQAAMLENAGGSEQMVAAINDQIRALEQRKSALADRSIADRLQEDAARAKSFNDLFVQSFADATVAITTRARTISGAIKDMVGNITSSISRLAGQKIGEAIFGAGTSSGGGGIFESIGPLFAKWFAGGFASGGIAPAGKVALVGERGPELIVPKNNSVIVPNDILEGRRAQRASNVVVNINVDGQTTRATADQIAVRTGAAVRRALNRNA